MIATAIEPILLDVELSVEEHELEMSVEEVLDVELETNIIVNPIEGETYDGPYRVIPQFDEQELLTQYKVMTQNVEVDAIPVSRTANLSGGTTVYIGGQF